MKSRLLGFFSSLIKFFIYFLCYFDIKLIYFVTKTRFGYALYLSSLAVLYGTKVNEPGLLFMLSAIFSGYTISTTIFFFILVKTPATRKLLSNTFGEDYLVAHLGAHMMTRPVLKVCGGVFAVIAAEKGAEAWDRGVNYRESDDIMARQEKEWQKTNHLPSKEERDTLFQESKQVRYKPPQGISDQLYKTFRKAVEKDPSE